MQEVFLFASSWIGVIGKVCIACKLLPAQQL